MDQSSTSKYQLNLSPNSAEISLCMRQICASSCNVTGGGGGGLNNQSSPCVGPVASIARRNETTQPLGVSTPAIGTRVPLPKLTSLSVSGDVSTASGFGCFELSGGNFDGTHTNSVGGAVDSSHAPSQLQQPGVNFEFTFSMPSQIVAGPSSLAPSNPATVQPPVVKQEMPPPASIPHDGLQKAAPSMSQDIGHLLSIPNHFDANGDMVPLSGALGIYRDHAVAAVTPRLSSTSVVHMSTRDIGSETPLINKRQSNNVDLKTPVLERSQDTANSIAETPPSRLAQDPGLPATDSPSGQRFEQELALNIDAEDTFVSSSPICVRSSFDNDLADDSKIVSQPIVNTTRSKEVANNDDLLIVNNEENPTEVQKEEDTADESTDFVTEPTPRPLQLHYQPSQLIDFSCIEISPPIATDTAVKENASPLSIPTEIPRESANPSLEEVVVPKLQVLPGLEECALEPQRSNDTSNQVDSTLQNIISKYDDRSMPSSAVPVMPKSATKMLSTPVAQNKSFINPSLLTQVDKLNAFIWSREQSKRKPLTVLTTINGAAICPNAVNNEETQETQIATSESSNQIDSTLQTIINKYEERSRMGSAIKCNTAKVNVEINEPRSCPSPVQGVPDRDDVVHRTPKQRRQIVYDSESNDDEYDENASIIGGYKILDRSGSQDLVDGLNEMKDELRPQASGNSNSLLQIAKRASFVIGDRVLAAGASDAHFYTGSISAMFAVGVFGVEFDNGESGQVNASDIRPWNIEPGDLVQVRCEAGEFKRAVIAARISDATFAVSTLDYSLKTDVNYKDIRLSQADIKLHDSKIALIHRECVPFRRHITSMNKVPAILQLETTTLSMESEEENIVANLTAVVNSAKRRRDAMMESDAAHTSKRIKKAATPARNTRNNSPVPSRHSTPKSRIFSGYQFLLTGLNSVNDQSGKSPKKNARLESLKQDIELNGGDIVELDDLDKPRRGSKETILISAKACRTTKYFYSLAKCVPRVNYKWAKQSVARRQFLNLDEFYLPNGLDCCDDEVPATFSCDIFLDLKFYIFAPKLAQDEKNQWATIIKAAGGEVVMKQNNHRINYRVSWVETPDKKMHTPNQYVTKEWLVQCLIQQKLLPVDAYKLLKK